MRVQHVKYMAQSGVPIENTSFPQNLLTTTIGKDKPRALIYRQIGCSQGKPKYKLVRAVALHRLPHGWSISEVLSEPPKNLKSALSGERAPEIKPYSL